MLAGLRGKKAFISRIRSERNTTPLQPEMYLSSLKEGPRTNKCLAPDQVQQIPVLNHTTLDLGTSKNACITGTCATSGESCQSCHSWQQVCFGGLLCGTSNMVFLLFSYGSASLSLNSSLCMYRYKADFAEWFSPLPAICGAFRVGSLQVRL